MATHQKLFVALLPLILLVACTRTPEQVMGQPPVQLNDRGRIWFYQRTIPGYFLGSWRRLYLDGQPTIYLDGQPRDRATPYEVYHVDVFTGHHEVGIKGNKVFFTVEKGQQVFIRAEEDDSIFGKRVYPILVDPQVGQEELKQKGFNINLDDTPVSLKLDL